MNELELWKQSKVRYERIGELIDGVLDGMRGEGNLELNIPTCSFCDEFLEKYNEHESGCAKCPWGKKFGQCGPGVNEWLKSLEILRKASSQNDVVVRGINNEIRRLRESQEVTP